MSRTELTKWRVAALIKEIKDEYERESIIRHVINSRETESSSLQFGQIGSRFRLERGYLIDSAGGTYYDPRVRGIGRSIAIGEEKHIVNTMLDRIVRHSSTSILSADAVSRSIDDVGHGFIPNTAFVPLTFHSDLHLQRDPSIHVSYGLGKDRGPYLKFGSWKLRLYWSNKYVPFTKLVFVDRRIGEWLVKPASDKHWLNIEITPAATSIDVTVKTIMRCEISRPELGLILDVSKNLQLGPHDEPKHLLALGQYQAAVVSSIDLLEGTLRQKLFDTKAKEKLDEIYATQSFTSMLRQAEKMNYVSSEDLELAKRLLSIRKRVTHANASVSSGEACSIVENVSRIINNLRGK